MEPIGSKFPPKTSLYFPCKCLKWLMKIVHKLVKQVMAFIFKFPQEMKELCRINYRSLCRTKDGGYFFYLATKLCKKIKPILSECTSFPEIKQSAGRVFSPTLQPVFCNEEERIQEVAVKNIMLMLKHTTPKSVENVSRFEDFFKKKDK